MTHENNRHEIATRRVVYRLQGEDAVTVLRNVAIDGAGGEPHTLDLYYPAGRGNATPTPAVLFVIGYPDEGMRKYFGCSAREMESYISWATLTAATGLVAITYTTTRPASDAPDVLACVRQHAASLGINRETIGLWACSGNVPTALSLLMDAQPRVACAVFLYGYMLDSDGTTAIADAARMFGFANPCAGRSLEDLPPDVPLFIARAGRDTMPGLNQGIDRFVASALALNLPVNVVNHHRAPHAFDISDDSETSREVVKQVLEFMRIHLRGA
jgi:acetyl esterase/lipase